jgi:hypothetical protein
MSRLPEFNLSNNNVDIKLSSDKKKNEDLKYFPIVTY